jgi:hypothetical protein
MDKKMYDMYKGDLVAAFKENCYVVYHVKKDQFLKGLFPPHLDIDDMSTEQKYHYSLAIAANCGLSPLFTEWLDEIDDSFRISDLISLGYILSALMWEHHLDDVKILAIDSDGDIVNFESMLSRDDYEFINELFDEYFEF